MLAPWIIDQKERERQQREDEASWERQPRVEAPRPSDLHPEEQRRPPEEPRGSVVIDFTI